MSWIFIDSVLHWKPFLLIVSLKKSDLNMTAHSVMWSNQVRNSKGIETHHFQLRRCRVSLLKLRLPWQRKKGGWASACWVQECRNAFWAAISLNLPSIRKEPVCQGDFFSEDTHSEDMYVKNQQNSCSQNNIYSSDGRCHTGKYQSSKQLHGHNFSAASSQVCC